MDGAVLALVVVGMIVNWIVLYLTVTAAVRQGSVQAQQQIERERAARVRTENEAAAERAAEESARARRLALTDEP